MSSNIAALSYNEPGIVTILILSSFLLLLNIINYVLDRFVYCGLVGQIFIGVGWGRPGADWLAHGVQASVLQFGYLGLILIVFQGGLSTNMKLLRTNLPLSSAVAFIGVSASIAISFALMPILPVTAVQAFAAGAALCSTSLGTVFTVLATSGLTESRLGIVLTTAAMMDDVMGLVMVQVISNLGQESASFSPISVVRPVLVSIAFATILPLLCVYVVRPLAEKLHTWVVSNNRTHIGAILTSEPTSFIFCTGILLGMVTASTYAGTSNLFATYLAGATITWLDSYRESLDGRGAPVQTPAATEEPLAKGREAPPSQKESNSIVGTNAPKSAPKAPLSSERKANTTGIAIYKKYYEPAVDAILKPFFFASIGFSIPIAQMFSGAIVWRGLVYAALMCLAKLLCGAPLIRIKGVPSARAAVEKSWPLSKRRNKKKAPETKPKNSNSEDQQVQSPVPNSGTSESVVTSVAGPSSTTTDNSSTANVSRKRERTPAPKPQSFYPAIMLGSAMVSRGEIGFLISSVAESNGVFGSSADGGSSEIFLVITWAILVCTLLGPLAVGLMVRRVKRLQESGGRSRGGERDPLGGWGVVPG